MNLVTCHAQQQAVQTGQDRLALRPYGAQALHPRSRLGIQRSPRGQGR